MHCHLFSIVLCLLIYYLDSNKYSKIIPGETCFLHKRHNDSHNTINCHFILLCFFFFSFSLQHFENYHNLSPGECAMYLNGIPIDIEVYDVYTLLDTMKSEAAVMEGLFSLGVKVSILLFSLMLDIVYN